jgi:hypothetical protein
MSGRVALSGRSDFKTVATHSFSFCFVAVRAALFVTARVITPRFFLAELLGMQLFRIQSINGR